MHRIKIIILSILILFSIVPYAFGENYICSTTPFIGSYCFIVEKATLVDKVLIYTYAQYYNTYYIYTDTELWINSFVPFEYVSDLLDYYIPDGYNMWY